MTGRCSAISRKAGPHRMWLIWKDKLHHSKYSPLPSSPHFIHWAWCHFGQLWSPALAVSSPNLPCTHSLLTSLAIWKGEMALALCNPCSATTRTSLSYHHCVQHSSIPATVKKTNSIPAKTSTPFQKFSHMSYPFLCSFELHRFMLLTEASIDLPIIKQKSIELLPHSYLEERTAAPRSSDPNYTCG